MTGCVSISVDVTEDALAEALAAYGRSLIVDEPDGSRVVYSATPFVFDHTTDPPIVVEQPRLIKTVSPSGRR